MVNVIDTALAVADVDQYAQHVKDVLTIQHTRAFHFFTPDTPIELHASNPRQVIALFGKEEVFEQILSCILGRRLAGTHHSVNFNQRFEFALGRIDIQRAGNIGSLVQVINVEDIQFLDARITQDLKQFLGHFSISVRQNLTGFFIDNGFCNNLSDQVLIWDFQCFHTGLFDHLHVSRGNTLAVGNKHFAGFAANVEERSFTT